MCVCVCVCVHRAAGTVEENELFKAWKQLLQLLWIEDTLPLERNLVHLWNGHIRYVRTSPTHTHTHTHTHTYTYAHTNTYTHIHTHTQTHTHTYTHIHKHIHTHTHTNTYTLIKKCTHKMHRLSLHPCFYQLLYMYHNAPITCMC